MPVHCHAAVMKGAEVNVNVAALWLVALMS